MSDSRERPILDMAVNSHERAILEGSIVLDYSPMCTLRRWTSDSCACSSMRTTRSAIQQHCSTTAPRHSTTAAQQHSSFAALQHSSSAAQCSSITAWPRHKAVATASRPPACSLMPPGTLSFAEHPCFGGSPIAVNLLPSHASGVTPSQITHY